MNWIQREDMYELLQTMWPMCFTFICSRLISFQQETKADRECGWEFSDIHFIIKIDLMVCKYINFDLMDFRFLWVVLFCSTEPQTLAQNQQHMMQHEKMILRGIVMSVGWVRRQASSNCTSRFLFPSLLLIKKLGIFIFSSVSSFYCYRICSVLFTKMSSWEGWGEEHHVRKKYFIFPLRILHFSLYCHSFSLLSYWHIHRIYRHVSVWRDAT